ncbi:glycosylphosphatidylinositol anchor biosynthesis [Maublancomyces gigas]|uniref:Glycosylphosphatidylinositol anchor biosynthesis n=1 Tax=Discina gigas TaxID=1032678 RepID=A0ABR3GBC6_9PEZI
MTLADFQTADPDNWVDPTFLSQLQRNINVHPYDFYSLVADSTVIVQHLSSVVIFVTSFIAISAKRVSPVAVAVASSALTVAGWAIWDMGYEKREAATDMRNMRMRLGLDIPGGPHSRTPSGNGSHLRTPSGNGNGGGGGLHSRTPSGSGNVNAAGSYFPPYHAGMESSGGSPTKRSVGEDRVVSTEADREYVKKAQRARRLTTAKSAALIYFTLLGLSPILRSLTTTISVDSIWAIATWLFLANCLGFDYGSGVEVKFPASLPTNAAITSSVVLASRLPDTTHVFSLILFSIQCWALQEGSVPW